MKPNERKKGNLKAPMGKFASVISFPALLARLPMLSMSLIDFVLLPSNVLRRAKMLN